MKTGIELIADERTRQVNVEGWTAEHDSHHTRGDLPMAGACYAALASAQQRCHMDFQPSEIYPPEKAPLIWPWADKWWKPNNDPVRNLVKAGALIAAEIDRLNRLNNK